MRAWLMDDFSGIDHLRLAEVPDPEPGPGEVLIRVALAGLNPADRYLAEKQYPAQPTLPHILGRDGAGTVVSLGPGCTGISAGEQRLILRGESGGNRPGTFAELVVVQADNLAAIPPGWTIEQSAGAALVYLTAYQALNMWGALPESSVVLITGASGGVGVACVQLASALGHTIIALTRNPAKAERLSALGATITLDPSMPDWRKRLRKVLSPRRVDLAVDNIGGALFSQVIDTLGDQGKVSVVGRLAGPVPDFNTATLFFRRIRIGGVAVGAYRPEETLAAWQQITILMQKENAHPVVDSIHPFDELLKAFERLSEGPMGKVLLQVSA